MTKEESFEKVEVILNDWRECREHLDATCLQKIRDELSDILCYIGKYESEYESKFKILGHETKWAIDDEKEALLGNGVKYTVDQLSRKAEKPHRELIMTMVHTENEYRRIKNIIGRCDQVLNSVGSGIRIITKG